MKAVATCAGVGTRCTIKSHAMLLCKSCFFVVCGTCVSVVATSWRSASEYVSRVIHFSLFRPICLIIYPLKVNVSPHMHNVEYGFTTC